MSKTCVEHGLLAIDCWECFPTPIPSDEDNECFNGNHESRNGRCIVDGGTKSPKPGTPATMITVPMTVCDDCNCACLEFRVDKEDGDKLCITCLFDRYKVVCAQFEDEQRQHISSVETLRDLIRRREDRIRELVALTKT